MLTALYSYGNDGNRLMFNTIHSSMHESRDVKLARRLINGQRNSAGEAGSRGYENI